MKILLTDVASVVVKGDLSLAGFEKLGEVKTYNKITREELLKEAKDSDAIIVNKTVIDREVIESSDTLKYIGLFATGYNNIDITAAKEKGIAVCNTVGYSTNAVAQQVIAYILNHYTKIAEYDRFVKADGWKKAQVFAPLIFKTEEVWGKTLGIIGYGSIGKAVEKAAEGLGMKVLINTRTVPSNDPKFVSFDELLQNSDVITIHCPLTDKTENLMDSAAFSKMRDGAYLINTSRGGVIVEEALLEALKSGKLSGAAVDVLREEPMADNCILQDAPNILITPHTAWGPYETRKRLVDIVVLTLENFIAGKEVNNLAK